MQGKSLSLSLKASPSSGTRRRFSIVASGRKSGPITMRGMQDGELDRQLAAMALHLRAARHAKLGHAVRAAERDEQVLGQECRGAGCRSGEIDSVAAGQGPRDPVLQPLVRCRRRVGLPRVASSHVGPDGYRVEAAIAIGRRGDKSRLPEAMQAREAPNGRLPLGKLVMEGTRPAGPDADRSVPRGAGRCKPRPDFLGLDRHVARVMERAS